MTVVVGLGAAIAGGFVCALIARDPRGPKWLVAVVVALGILFAIPVLTGAGAAATGGPRPEDVPMFEAMMNAIQPVWVALLNALLGAVAPPTPPSPGAPAISPFVASRDYFGRDESPGRPHRGTW